jgi:hypothetical protein
MSESDGLDAIAHIGRKSVGGVPSCVLESWRVFGCVAALPRVVLLLVSGGRRVGEGGKLP